MRANFDKHNPDIVIHLAAVANSRHIEDDPIEAVQSPLTGDLNIGSGRRSMHEYAKLRSPNLKAMSMADLTHKSSADTSLNPDGWTWYRRESGE